MKKTVLIRFGKAVRDERQKRGYSQEDLAARAALHRTYIGMVERAEKNITLLNINKIASALRVSIAYLLK
jgi:transcriptional regulator with XRE-family HTH domain